ncbi:MAG TPA: Gfo/Idh/MocA family oxidoreductase, partial [Candidatus Sumerlaeota bacterium]|nr:Gfo/Idh/MocA family oxidoreductase [Candidatus Sumerlaeota bacterium]
TRLIGVADRYPEVAKRVAEAHQCEAYPSVKAMLANPQIEAVYIASPVFLHKEHAMLAADAGKQILLEKPLGVTLAECREVAAYCRRKKVRLMPALMMRFHPLHRQLRQWVAGGQLGRIVQARAQLSHFHVEYNADGSRNWRQDPKKSGGGALMDMGIHCVDLLRVITGREIVNVSARIETLENDYKIEDTGVLLFSFDNGAVGIVDSTFAARGAQHVIELYGTERSVFVENSISQIEEGTWYEATGPIKRKLPYRKRPNYQYAMYTSEVDEMNRAIMEDDAPAITPRDALIAQAVVQTGYQAAKAGRRLAIPSSR